MVTAVAMAYIAKKKSVECQTAASSGLLDAERQQLQELQGGLNWNFSATAVLSYKKCRSHCSSGAQVVRDWCMQFVGS
jgi:hypothetical protein